MNPRALALAAATSLVLSGCGGGTAPPPGAKPARPGAPAPVGGQK